MNVPMRFRVSGLAANNAGASIAWSRCDRWRIFVPAVMAALGLSLQAVDCMAHGFGDDHGDFWTNAHALVLGVPSGGRIEIDADEDWFSFPVSPLKKYSITATTGTLWDTAIDLKASDGTTTGAATNSVFTAPSTIGWMHFGPSATCYVLVKGSMAFTTGTYSVAVSETDFTDLDGDGMEDEWEDGWFGSTNEASGADWDYDGASNGEEFRLGTSPTDPLSRLRISSLQYSNQFMNVIGAVQPFRCYALSVRTNLLTGVWERKTTATNYQFSGTMIFTDDDAEGSPRFYRIECLY